MGVITVIREYNEEDFRFKTTSKDSLSILEVWDDVNDPLPGSRIYLTEGNTRNLIEVLKKSLEDLS